MEHSSFPPPRDLPQVYGRKTDDSIREQDHKDTFDLSPPLPAELSQQPLIRQDRVRISSREKCIEIYGIRAIAVIVAAAVVLFLLA